VRWTAAGAVAVLAAFHILRITASTCGGTGCDLYIPLSLVLPLAAVVLVAVTGIAGLTAARNSEAWRIAIAVTAALGVVGPFVALGIWRDSPDVLVAVATVLLLLCPACVLGYSVLATRAEA
jgi:hypothetical protein